VQDYADAAMALAMKTVGEATVREAKIYQVGANGDSDLLLWHWLCPASAEAEPTATDKTGVTATLSEDWKLLDVTLNPAFFSFPVGQTELRFEVIDNKDARTEKKAVIRVNEGILSQVDACDLWANSVTLRAVSTKGVPTFKLRLQGTDEWKTVAGVSAGGNEYTAVFASDEDDWTVSDNAQAGVPVYRPRKEHCVYANNTYEIAAEIDGHEYRTTYRPVCDQPIPNGDMADASCSCFGLKNETTDFWGSGNNDYMKTIIGDALTHLCNQATKSGRTCALLSSQYATMLAAGNLFTGTFVKPSTQGTVGFGKDYDWKARPTAMHISYHATIGLVDCTKYKKDGKDPIAENEQDKVIVYVAIVDWKQPHGVSSGLNEPSGMWSPDEAAEQPEGPIIGYGKFVIDASTEGTELVDMEIPIYYYDKVMKPSNDYKLVISCATNLYGDYMNGCKTNKLYITDFSWVY
ncbi:MAG: PCMD domain-containing protein, partial [Alistipes sp.]|nr:PCMD domain-containing protein [Alistipes sp.]